MKQLFLSIFIGLSITTITQAQTRWHVKIDAVGSNSGLTWVDAFPNLNAALNASQSGDSIWVAAGEYKPTAGTDRTLSFTQKSGTVLLGGFNGTETAASQRNWLNNLVLLSGDIGAIGDSTDNSFTILYMNKPDSSTILDGFSLAFGVANSTNNLDPVRGRNRSGGALYINGENTWAYADIRNCTFSHCYAWGFGGAVYVNGAGAGSVAPRFLNCKFFRNNARLDGGGLYRDGGSWVERFPDFWNCVFEKNESSRKGSGLCYNESERIDTIELVNCSFIENMGIANPSQFGGALTFQSGRLTGSNLIIKKSNFSNNSSSQGNASALLYLSPSELYTNFISLHSCRFENHTSDIFTCALFPIPYQGQPEKLTRFEGDSLTFLHSQSSDISFDVFGEIKLSNCLFGGHKIPFGTTTFSKVELRNIVVANETGQPTGILSFYDTNSLVRYSIENMLIRNWKIHQDGIVQLPLNTLEKTEPVIIRNATLVNNIFVPATSPTGFLRSIEYQNCHFATNEFTVFKPHPINGPKKDTVRYINCAFKSLDCSTLPPNVICGPGLLANVPDPLFRDTAAHDYRLLPCSPLLNKGTNQGLDSILTDLAGQPRILNGTVDIGAYETELSIENTATSPTSCAGAANGSASFSATACLPLTIAWSGGSSTDSTLTGLAAGQYPLTITDSNGYSKLDSLTIESGPPLTYSLATAPVKCFGDSTGSASFFLFDATQPVDYEWITGDSSASISNLPAGQFGITATDSLGCAASATVEIDQPQSPLEVSLPVILPVDCPDEMTGLAEASASGGTPDFQFLWSGGQVGPMQNGLAGGPISLTVTDANGCTDSVSTVILEPQPIGIQANILNATGPANADGQLEIDSIFGGTGPFQFIWSNGLAGDSIGGLLPGDYVVSVIDNQGCLDTFQLTVDFTIGLRPIENLMEKISLSPNPVRQSSTAILSITAIENSVFSIEMLDEKGAVIFQKNASLKSGQNNFSVLSPNAVGAYFIRLKFDNGDSRLIRWIVAD